MNVPNVATTHIVSSYPGWFELHGSEVNLNWLQFFEICTHALIQWRANDIIQISLMNGILLSLANTPIPSADICLPSPNIVIIIRSRLKFMADVHLIGGDRPLKAVQCRRQR